MFSVDSLAIQGGFAGFQHWPWRGDVANRGDGFRLEGQALLDTGATPAAEQLLAFDLEVRGVYFIESETLMMAKFGADIELGELTATLGTTTGVNFAPALANPIPFNVVASSVPEPASAPMLLAGAAFMALALRRREAAKA